MTELVVHTRSWAEQDFQSNKLPRKRTTMVYIQCDGVISSVSLNYIMYVISQSAGGRIGRGIFGVSRLGQCLDQVVADSTFILQVIGFSSALVFVLPNGPLIGFRFHSTLNRLMSFWSPRTQLPLQPSGCPDSFDLDVSTSVSTFSMSSCLSVTSSHVWWYHTSICFVLS